MHGRQNSASSISASSHHGEPLSYVQQMRMAKATVWAERGPKDAVYQKKKPKPQTSARKGMFGIKLFNGGSNSSSNQTSNSTTNAKPSKTKLRLYAAPQHNTLVPRLSASEANDVDEFDNFTSTAPPMEKRTSNAPSLARSSLIQSRTGSLYNNSSNTPNIDSSLSAAAATTTSSPGPVRMDSVTSSLANSILRDPEDMFSRKPLTTTTTASAPSPQFALYPSSGFTTSRSGSPTQLQQYTMQHLGSDSDDDVDRMIEQRPRLFVANADLSDSD